MKENYANNAKSIYINPTSDFGFKKIFGEEANKDLLIDFLNSMLDKQYHIKELKFQVTEQLPNHGDDRKAIFDIYCESILGEKFIIEMQNADSGFFFERSIYYGTFAVQKQAIKGKWDYNFARVFFIGILDFNYDTDLKYWKKRKLLRNFTLCDDNGVKMSDKLHYMYLQLRFFKKKSHQLKTQFDKWCYFLKNLEYFDSIPKILNEEIFMKAFETSKVSNLSDAEYIMYQISNSKRYDIELIEETAVRRGVKSGIEKGEKIGIEKGEKIGIEKGEKIGIEKGEKIGIEKGEKIGIEKGEKIGIEKGEKIGIEKGEKIGIKKAMEITILNAFDNSYKPESISNFTGIPLTNILEILKKNERIY
jgi:predicted transposase/invertase (TIGR01784 family)